MTEITERKINNHFSYDFVAKRVFLIKTSRKPGYLIDPVAFFIALVAGPLVVTAVSFWILLIPVFALVFGGPIYLVMGTPLLLIHLRRNQASVRDLMTLGFLAALALFPILGVATQIVGEQILFNGGFFLLAFGLLFGPLWAGAFGAIYLKLRRDFYAVARPI
jgi:hypothetical protein